MQRLQLLREALGFGRFGLGGAAAALGVRAGLALGFELAARGEELGLGEAVADKGGSGRLGSGLGMA